MRATNGQIQRFWGLFSKLGLREDKAAKSHLIRQYTNNRTASLKEMSVDEMKALLAYLEGQTKTAQQMNEQAENRDELKRRRSMVLKEATKLFPELKDKDYKRFNAFLLEKGKYRKELWKHSVAELEQLKRQFIGMQRNNEKTENNAKATKAVGSMMDELGIKVKY